MNQYRYENDWRAYSFPQPEAEFASSEDVCEKFSQTILGPGEMAASGLPLCVKDQIITVNNETENALIFGGTGSKKTRCTIMPLVANLACAGESIVLTDVKGELATNPKIRGLLDDQGYQTVFLDFRNFTGDSYNILELPYAQYCRGNTDKAMEEITRIVKALNTAYQGTKADPFWTQSSELHSTSLFNILLEVCSSKRGYDQFFNMLSMCSFANQEGTNTLIKIMNSYFPLAGSNPCMMNLRGILSSADNTLRSIVVSTLATLNPFLIQPSLTRMLSSSTFDAASLYEKKTAVFFIIPDECSAYDEIAGLLIDNLYNQLIDVYTRNYQNHAGGAPRRVAFVLDEFCNVRINDMSNKISACRSRFIRMYLVCQSLKQLRAAYPDSADTILGNCQNILFMSSSDPTLMDYICELAGTTTISEYGAKEHLVNHGMLKRLQKTWEYKEALYIREDVVFRTRLPDIDQYSYLDRYASDEPAEIPGKSLNEVKAYTPGMLLYDLEKKRIPLPFSGAERVRRS